MKAFNLRVLLGALLFFCVIAAGFTFWYHHQLKKLAAEDNAFKQRQEERNLTHPRAPIVTPQVIKNPQPVERLSQPGNTLSVSPAATKHSEETEGTPDSDAELPSAESNEEIAEDVSVSPYGFGPYPPLPAGWPSDIWPRQSANHELMMRVEIKLAHQGIDVRGSVMDNGLVYPMIPGTVHIKWEEYLGPPGIVRYIATMIGDPAACNRIEAIVEAKGDDFTEADIPSDIKIVPFEEGGIDAYEFLGLQRR